MTRPSHLRLVVNNANPEAAPMPARPAGLRAPFYHGATSDISEPGGPLTLERWRDYPEERKKLELRGVIGRKAILLTDRFWVTEDMQGAMVANYIKETVSDVANSHEQFRGISAWIESVRINPQAEAKNRHALLLLVHPQPGIPVNESLATRLIKATNEQLAANQAPYTLPVGTTIPPVYHSGDPNPAS